MDKVEVKWGSVLLVLLAVGLSYAPLGRNDFVNLDDGDAILNNPHIRSWGPESFHWMFTTFHLGNWIPLTWLSLSLDYQLGKLDPAYYHWHSLALHLLNTLLVFLLAEKLYRRVTTLSGSDWIFPSSLLTMLFFGLHPIHVESVAWAAERKDVLYAFFFLASLLVYLSYISDKKPLKLGLCLALFLFALMAKPMAVSLPVVLLILDVWPLGRWSREMNRMIPEKIPFFMMALGASVLAYQAQLVTGAVNNLQAGSFLFRVSNAFHSLVFYIWKTLVPMSYSVFYPFPPAKNPFTAENLACLLLVASVAVVCFLLRRQQPWLAAAFGFHFVAVLPVLGLIQVGSQAAADRYTYLPTLGPVLLAAAWVGRRLAGDRALFLSLAAILAAVLGFQTWRQVGVWETPLSLWQNAARNVSEPSEVIALNLGEIYQKAGRYPEALQFLNTSIRLNPNLSDAHATKGLILMDQGDYAGGAGELQTAVNLSPQKSVHRAHLCLALIRLNRLEEAVTQGLEAVRLDPLSPTAYDNLGVAYGQEKDWAKSAEAFQKAVELEPGDLSFRKNLETVRSQIANPSPGKK